MSGVSKEKDPFIASLGKIYAGYTGGFAAFVILIAILEQMGVPDRILGYLFVGLTIGVYAYIGIISRTQAVAEYYVAGRRVPQTELRPHAVAPVPVVAVGERGEHVGGDGDGGVGVVGEGRQEGLGEAREVPLRDAGLVAVRVATTLVDRAEHRRRVVGVHERARAVVDRLARDGRVVGVHHAVDEPHSLPFCDKFCSTLDSTLKKYSILVGLLYNIRIITLNGKLQQTFYIFPLTVVVKKFENTEAYM